MKVSADGKLIVTKKLQFALGRIQNIVGKGENAGYHLPAFSPFPTMFSKGFFPRIVKSWDCVVKS